MDGILPSSDNLRKMLGFTPGFTKYLSGIIGGMYLDTKAITESGHFGEKVTISLTYCTEDFGKRRENSQKGGKTSPQGGKPPSTPPRKKKTPSQRRRDRERFRAWVARKKQPKLKSVKIPPAKPVQCPPPPDVTISPPAVPPPITLAKPAAPVSTVTLPPQPSEPVTVPSASCLCDVCVRFEDKVPLSEELYGECHNCGKVATEDQPLKPCAQCLSRAYCSRECQRIAWKSGHKKECDKDFGEKLRRMRESWNACREVWLEHQQRRPPQTHPSC